MTDKRRILIIDPTMPDVGGVRTYVDNLRSLLDEQGHCVDVYQIKRDGGLIDKYVIGSIRFLLNRIASPIGSIVGNWLSGILFDVLVPGNYDIYIVQQLQFLKKSYRKKSICILHALWTDNLQGSKISSWALKKCNNYEKYLVNNYFDIIYTVSKEYADYINEKYNVGKPLNYIENFLAEEFLERNWEDRGTSIVFTGQFNERKNLSYIMEITRIMKSQGYRDLSVKLIGDGPSERTLREMIREYELLDYVDILISPPRQQIKEELAKAKIFIMPSVKESFSYSLLEAKLSGCITVANKELDVPSGFIDFPIDIKKYEETVKIIKNILENENSTCIERKTFENPIDQARKKYSQIIASM